MSEIKPKFSAVGTLTITLAGLASSTAGVGRQSTLVDNATTRHRRIRLFVKVKSGTVVTAGQLQFWRIRSDKNTVAIRTDNAGASDAAITAYAAVLLHAIEMRTGEHTHYTEFFLEDPGPEWGIIVTHSSGVNLSATAADHAITWIGETDEVV
jgi:hypothetical protein